ncbi:BTB/POZ domain-containing protein 16-like isoform X2 [Antedon mediterranea]|uniref:BTB/POZ domain-containing protein 16-like isoform X2 n=1 Tax=Antedon mediterranea TaxID=105859 RepID=UPI003AF97136
MSSDFLLLSPVDSSAGQQSKLPFLPAVPPKMPKELLSYTIAFQDAPLTALRGVVVDGRQPPRLQVSPRSRVRSQVGCTNRWRLPESLGGDLLGRAQALKSLNEHYSQSIMAVMTADNPATSLNVNTQDHLNQQDLHRRPCTSPRKDSKHKDSPDVNKRNLATAPGRLSVGSCHPIKKYQPTSARSPTPLDIFHYHSYPVKNLLGPDILLECLNSNWELHRPYIQKSGTLTTLLQQASQEPKKELYYRDPMCATLDQYINKSQYYSNEYQEMSRRLSMTDSTPQNKQKRDKDHPGHTTPARRSIVTKLKLKVTDVFVTKEALAVALGNLYHDKLEVNNCSIVSVLACASMLQFEDLIKRCEHLMLRSIHSETVCSYHYAGVKYKVGSVVTACERWLELNLIPSLSVQIHLRELPLILLQRLLKSSRLFVYNEYYVYKLLCYWIFLQHHPHIMLMPSHSTIVTFFNSLPKNCSFIEREDGQAYAGLFLSLRMHGITDTRNLDDMVRMNVVPQPWVLKMLSQHYQALQGGGDMSLMLNFNNDAIRAGFIIEQEPRYHTEVISLYGFHFELKAHRLGKEHTYQFYMQRLKPHDPTLSFKACERQTFSMRQDREVRYSIRTQSKIDGNDYMFNTGILSKKFGLGSKTSRSEILTLEGLSLPIYVTFSLLFPPS